MSEINSQKALQEPEPEEEIGEGQSHQQQKLEKSGIVKTRIYCNAECCIGELVEAEILDQPDCPVCYNSFESEKIAIAKNCNHLFCKDCIAIWGLGRTGCPMCRQEIESLVFTFTPILTPKNTSIGTHATCYLSNSVAKEYLGYLNLQWQELIGFILKTQLPTSKIIGVKGTEHLKLEKYEADGRLECKDKVFVVVKSDMGYTQVVFCCFLPNSSIRLVISKETIDIETDNKAADEIVEYMNIQLNACWRILPHLWNKKHLRKTFVRKFENVTCTLVITGVIDYVSSYIEKHQTPMETQLKSLNKCNFDENFERTVLHKIPPLLISNLKISSKYRKSKCCF